MYWGAVTKASPGPPNHIEIEPLLRLRRLLVHRGLLAPGTGLLSPDIVSDVGLEGLSDADLWELVAAHDGEAFAVLFDRYADKVYNHCFRRLADWSMAEDLASVVFLEAWRKRGQVRLYGDSALPWLLAVANNSLRNADRSRRRYHRLLSRLPMPEDAPAFDTQASDRVDDEATMRRLLSVLRQLNIEDQEVIALCDWSSLSYEEAATALDIPVGTVKSRLSRARARLRALIDPAGAGRKSSIEHGGVNP
jgi:RNA polymerase sigma-70 factor (ECF subfamily)